MSDLVTDKLFRTFYFISVEIFAFYNANTKKEYCESKRISLYISSSPINGIRDGLLGPL